MNNNIFDNHSVIDRTDIIPSGGSNLISLPTPASLILPSSVKTGNQMIKSAVEDAAHEQCRALLTKSALENAAALSALEAYMIRVAPLGAERYKAIVDSYAISAARKVMGW